MLDMGFIPDIERICKLLPAKRQTLFFSATMPPEIQRLADTFLSQPGPRRGVASGDRRGHRQPVPRRGRPRAGRQAGGAARAHPRRRRLQERDHLLQSQARRRHPAAVARPPRLQCRRTARRHGPAGAHGDARRLQARPADPAGRQRRGGPRPRYSGGQPHLQFRRSDPFGGLHPPHRPHRPRRPERYRHHHRDADRPEVCRPDREDDGKGDPAACRRGFGGACGGVLRPSPRQDRPKDTGAASARAAANDANAAGIAGTAPRRARNGTSPATEARPAPAAMPRDRSRPKR